MREQVVAALDVGTSKICCMIAKIGGDLKKPQVIGSGLQESRGLRNGAIIDLEETETAIRSAVDAAERMAGGAPIESVIVNISAGIPMSRHFTVDVTVSGHEITDIDIRRVLQIAQKEILTDDDYVIHSRPICYNVDSIESMNAPVGMHGENLSVQMHMSTIAISPLKNLRNAINRCHLNMSHVVLSAYASGLSVLVDEEMKQGCVNVDIGGGTTSIAAFKNGEYIYGAVLSLGGNDVISDIAQGLSTSEARAKRLKTFHGNCLTGQVLDRDLIDVVQIGDGGHEYTTSIEKKRLTSIINPRVEEILEMVSHRLKASGVDEIAGSRIILTGGLSKIQGLEELASRKFGTKVRLGKPVNVDGLADVMSGPEFSVCTGLLNYLIDRPEETHQQISTSSGGGIFSRTLNWIKMNF
jgi:cell division protein FtsA